MRHEIQRPGFRVHQKYPATVNAFVLEDDLQQLHRRGVQTDARTQKGAKVTLGLEQPFGPLAPGDVLRHSHQSNNVAIRVHDFRRAQKDREFRPVFPAVQHLPAPAVKAALLQNL